LAEFQSSPENKEEEMKKSEEIVNKKNNEIDLPKITNSEVNLFVFPFFALERKDNCQ